MDWTLAGGIAVIVVLGFIGFAWVKSGIKKITPHKDGKDN